eukprot:snap_masked-scaffold_20-processed-gene-1.15-mRNA-1 protein AED:1.00 eAED:1.00 QI:0/0/0/0/1/1/2/0/122
MLFGSLIQVHMAKFVIDNQLVVKTKSESFDKKQNPNSFIGNQTQNHYQIIIDKFHQILPLVLKFSSGVTMLDAMYFVLLNSLRGRGGYKFVSIFVMNIHIGNVCAIDFKVFIEIFNKIKHNL